MKPIYYTKHKSPCQECKERHLHCHSECEKYLDYRKKHEEVVAENRKKIETYRAIVQHEKEQRRLVKQRRVKSPLQLSKAKK